MSSITIDPLLGRQLAKKFEIRELLGVGAMGKVYRAHHEGLDKPVAIKVLIPAPAIAEAQARRFKAEARAASRLEHPNSVQILDFGEEQDGLLYIVMEYLQGIDLQDLIAQQGPLQSHRTAWIMSQVFSAMGAAHTNGVLHRDIKPGNVMLIEKVSEDGPIRDFVKVCDFGLAKILDPGANMTGGPLTAQGAVFGTPAYMSPEQALGETLDARSDIYSCGVLMYKMLVGHAPFRAESPTGVLLGHIHETPPDITSWGINIHPRLAAVVQRAMQKSPEHRYQNAREARDDLRAMLDSEGLSTPPQTAAMPVPGRSSTHVPTEQVRLRNDERPTQEHLQDTLLDRPTGDSERTEYADTIDPAKLEAARIDAARTKHQLAPVAGLAAAAQSTAVPPAAPTPAASPPVSQSWWALIPGGLALAAALIIFAFVVLRAPEAPTPAQTPSRAQSTDTAPEPPPEPQTATAPTPAEAPTAAEDSAEPSPSAPPAATPAPQKRAAPATTAARTRAQPAQSGSAANRAAPSPAQAPTAKTSPQNAPAALIPSAKPSLAPQTPSAAPNTDVRLLVTLAKVQVQGAMSRQRCQDALTRHLPKAGECLEPLVPASRMRVAGEVIATADVDAKGRLRNLKSQGLTGATPCLINAFASARLPEDDMGMAKVRFTLRYRTVSP